jgi:hypothetical protein
VDGPSILNRRDWLAPERCNRRTKGTRSAGRKLIRIVGSARSPTGAWLTHHLKTPDESFDFEICVPVAKPVADAGRVRAGRLRSAKVARVVYVGPYEGLGAAWGEFRAWIAANGHTCARICGSATRRVQSRGPMPQRIAPNSISLCWAEALPVPGTTSRIQFRRKVTQT